VLLLSLLSLPFSSATTCIHRGLASRSREIRKLSLPARDIIPILFGGDLNTNACWFSFSDSSDTLRASTTSKKKGSNRIPEGSDQGRDGRGCRGTQTRADFNNGDFQAIINEFAERVLLGTIMESEEKGGDEEETDGRNGYNSFGLVVR